MERKIGEIFEFKKDWYQCVEGRCKDCHFSEKRFLCKQFITKDFCAHGIIFKKLEKVGEPYYSSYYKQVLQEYKYYTSPIISDTKAHILKLGIVRIEIKQNKEDMEEKNNGNTPLNVLTDKYVNGDICYDDFEKEVKALYSCKEEIKPTLKEFDLEEAKAGKPVCTRDGRKARIICFDKKCLDEQILIVLVDCGKEESIYFYTTDGKCIDDFSSFDLMMLTEKKSGWVNIYRGQVYNAFEKAEEARKIAEHGGDNCLKTIKINWEE